MNMAGKGPPEQSHKPQTSPRLPRQSGSSQNMKKMTTKNPFNASQLWEKICEYAKKGGRLSTRPLLLLYYVMTSPDTPGRDKWLIGAAIGYVVLPIDLLPARKLPIIGWVDELVSVSFAFEKCRKYVTAEMERKADEQLDKWFPENTAFTEVTE